MSAYLYYTIGIIFYRYGLNTDHRPIHHSQCHLGFVYDIGQTYLLWPRDVSPRILSSMPLSSLSSMIFYFFVISSLLSIFCLFLELAYPKMEYFRQIVKPTSNMSFKVRVQHQTNV